LPGVNGTSVNYNPTAPSALGFGNFNSLMILNFCVILLMLILN